MDKQIMHYYRSGYSVKSIAEKTGLTLGQIKYRLQVIKKKQPLLRWWEEEPDYMFAWKHVNI